MTYLQRSITAAKQTAVSRDRKPTAGLQGNSGLLQFGIFLIRFDHNNIPTTHRLTW